MSVCTVSIDRSSLPGGPSPLVISEDGPDYRFTEAGVGYVTRSVRVTTMPDSADINGSEIVSFVLEESALPLEFHVIGSSSADVAAKVAALDEALYRLDYPVTRTVDGVATTYTAGPCLPAPSRGNVDSGVLAAHFETYAVTIPFPNPVGE